MADDRDTTTTGAGADAPDEDEGWRFGLDDVDEDGIVDDGPEREQSPIEPESVSAENALFVAVGVLGTVLVLLSATL